MIAWSWSRIESFEACPKKFFHENIKKDYKPDFEAPHFKRGNRIHTHLENALKTGTVDPEIKHMAKMVFSLKGFEWDYVGIEDEYAYTEGMQKTSWRDWRNCWVRCKMDFVGIKDEKAVVIDWKTGKNRGYKDQLALNAAVTFHAHPEVNKVDTRYVFVDESVEVVNGIKVDKRVEPKVFYREQNEHLWQDFGERAEAIQIASDKGEWTPKKHFGCRWCPVKECENYQGG